MLRNMTFLVTGCVREHSFFYLIKQKHTIKLPKRLYRIYIFIPAIRIQTNYDRIRQEVRQIVEDEITRIKNDPELCHLIKEEE